jgi:hypothetical protein
MLNLKNQFKQFLMRKLKILFIVLCAFVYTEHIYGQLPEVPKSVLSPNVASLGLYGDIPVSYYTGVPNINIPLYEEVVNSFRLPISLSYHASGVIPDQRAGWTGINWTLQAGGVITRTIKDKPDEYNNQKRIGKRGYYYTHDVLNTDMWNNKAYLLNMASDPELALNDKEPDVFSFKFLNYSGKFFLDHKGQWIVKCEKPLKIEFDNSYLEIPFNKNKTDAITKGFYPCFSGFTITTEDGTKYIFGGNIESIDFSINFMQQYEDEWDATAWNLTKITLPTKQEINFIYERGNFNCQLYYATYHNLGSGTTRSGSSIFNPLPSCSGDNYPSFDSGYSGHLISPVYLSQIVTDKSSIAFMRSESNELKYNTERIFNAMLGKWGVEEPFDANRQGKVAFLPYLLRYVNTESPNYDPKVDGFAPNYASGKVPYPECLETLKWFKLDSIEVVDILNNTSEKTIVFNYNQSPTQRLVLESVKETGKAPYQFSYNNIDKLPDYLECKTDHWGFFNNTFGGIMSHPEFDWDIYNDKYGYMKSYLNYYNSRESNGSVLQYGILNKIIYPTGGYSEFEFEPHYYRKQVKKERWNGYDELSSNKIAGGLRIKKQKSSDPNTGNSQTISEYFYVTDYLQNKSNANLSSGVLGGQIQYLFRDYTVSDNQDSSLKFVMNGFSTISVMPSCDNANGSHIGYSEVIEKREDNSFVRYKFTNFDTGNLDEPADAILQESRTPYESYASKDQERGNLILKEEFDANSNLVRQKTISYEKDADSDNYIRSINATSKYICSDSERGYSEGTSYKTYTYSMRPIKETETFYYPLVNKIQTTTEKEYLYNKNKLLISETTTISKGNRTEKHMTEFRFPSDITNVPAYADMAKNNMLNYPVEIIDKVDGYITKSRLITYENLFPKDIYFLEIKKPLLSSSFNVFDGVTKDLNYGEPDLSFSKYYNFKNSKNIAEIRDKNGEYTTYLWGNKSQCRIADIKNGTYNQVEAAVKSLGKTIEELSESNKPDINFNALREALPNSQITAYAYDRPLVGVSAITDPSGVTNYYKYDDTGRLMNIKDHNENKIVGYSYRYANQPFPSTLSIDIVTKSAYTISSTARFEANVSGYNEGSLVFNWYLKDSNGNIVSSLLNTAHNYFNVILNKLGKMTLSCIAVNSDLSKGGISERIINIVPPLSSEGIEVSQQPFGYHADGSPIFYINDGLSFKAKVINGSGNFTYNWYLKGTSGNIIKTYLNDTKDEFTIAEKLPNKMIVSCVVKDIETGDVITINQLSNFYVKAQIGFTSIWEEDPGVRATGELNIPFDMYIVLTLTYTTRNQPYISLGSADTNYTILSEFSENEFETKRNIGVSLSRGQQLFRIYMDDRGSASLKIEDSGDPFYIVDTESAIEIYSDGK